MRTFTNGLRLTLALTFALATGIGVTALAGQDDEAAQRPATPAGVDTSKDAEAKSRLDERSSRELGEDLGLDPEEDPLTRIARLMRRAEERTAKADTSDETRRVQLQIVDNLDELIQQIRRRQRQNQKSAGDAPKQGDKRAQAKQPDKPPESGDGQPGSNPTERAGRAVARSVNMAEMTSLLKDLWGHLPDRRREEMINAFGEQFLPKYEVQIEKYFKRLAEEPGTRATGRE